MCNLLNNEKTVADVEKKFTIFPISNFESILSLSQSPFARVLLTRNILTEGPVVRVFPASPENFPHFSEISVTIG